MIPNKLEASASDSLLPSSLLQSHWGVDSANLTEINLGNALCWKVTTSSGENWFLKQLREEVAVSGERIEEILEVQNYFASQGLPVVRPSRSNEGKLYILEGEAYFILYPFVHSNQKTNRSELNQTNLDSMADTLARMHIVGGQTQAPKISKIFKGWKDPSKYNPTIAQLRAHILQKNKIEAIDDIDIRVLRALDIKERIINKPNISYPSLGLESDHLTHGDYQERNVFFNNKDQVEWVIDFDTCEMGPRARELARAIDLLCIDRNDLSSKGLEKARTFYQRYNAIYPITADELYRGWFTCLMKNAQGLFGYTEYYFKQDPKAKKFILDDNAEALEEYFERLREIVGIVTKFS